MISVIMSVYNEKTEWLKKSIESILNQTYKDIEFIITLDNPNNDELKGIILNYKSLDKRIVYIENEKNMGLVWSLNNMLNFCNGDYIARMDADDISLPSRLDKQFEYSEKNHIDLLGCCTRTFNDETEYINELYINNTDIQNNIGNGAYVPHPTWFVKKNVYDELNGYRNIKYAEDYDFLLRAIKHGFILGNLNEALLMYRFNNESISRKNALKQKITSIFLYDNIDNIDCIDINKLEKECSSVTEKQELKYSHGEKLYYQYKEEKKTINKFFITLKILIFYSCYLKYNKFRNTKMKLSRKLGI